MEMPRPTEADKTRFRSVAPDDPRVEIKPMFGNLGAFVNGNMFMGLFGADIGVKLDDAGAAELRTVDGAKPFGPAERPMGGYVTLPGSMVGTDDGGRWIARSLDHVGALPPKAPKPSKR
jgi:TfoX/Sxy family transcriptional regulator of competence genes